MRENRVADFVAPTVRAQPRNTDKWVAFSRAAFEIGVPFVIHVVQQADGFPKIGVFAAHLGKMFHRIGDSVAVFSQAFGLDPVVQNSLGASGERVTHCSI